MKSIVKLSSLVAFLAVGLAVQAAGGKETTVTGEGKCAKCALKKSDTCQNVVEVKNGNKSEIYYLTGDASKAYHKNLCSGSANVTVTGVCTEKDGKKSIEVSKIVAAK